MSIIGFVLFLLFGLIVGLLARAILPGRQHMSVVMTTLLGVGGALLGGLVVTLLTRSPPERFEPAGFIGSLLGAILLLWAYTAFTRRRHKLL